MSDFHTQTLTCPYCVMELFGFLVFFRESKVNYLDHVRVWRAEHDVLKFQVAMGDTSRVHVGNRIQE